MDILKLIAELVYPSIFTRYDTVQKKKDEILFEYKRMKEEYDKLNSMLESCNAEVLELQKNSNGEKLSELEKFCMTNYNEVPKFAYKNKIFVKDLSVPVYPNEMITPDSYIIEKLRKEIGPKSAYSILDWYLRVAWCVDRHIRWTSDYDVWGLVDRYSYPNKSIVLGKEDCENHSFVVSSIEPETGFAYGFHDKTRHAFNVFIHDNELYVLETNSVNDKGKNYKYMKYKDNPHYTIEWIFTKNKTFKVGKHNTHYGVIEK